MHIYIYTYSGSVRGRIKSELPTRRWFDLSHCMYIGCARRVKTNSSMVKKANKRKNNVKRRGHGAYCPIVHMHNTYTCICVHIW